jgi:hypothetical protein
MLKELIINNGYSFAFSFTIISLKLSSPASRFSIISAAKSSGSGRLSRSARDLSFCQVISRLVLSREVISSIVNLNQACLHVDRVIVTELNLVATTNEDGYYLFDEVPVDSFTFSYRATGYKLPENVPVSVTCTEPLQLNFSQEPAVGEQAA